MEFDIKPYVVKDCSSYFDNMIQQVRSVKDGVGRVRRNISINSASTANIRTSLRNSQNNMEALIEKLASLENGLDVAVDLYLSCERNILGQQNNNTNSSSGRKGLSGWWSNFKEWASTGVWDDPDKAARIKRDKAMAKELRDLLKSERFSKKTWKKASVEERKQILTELFAEMQRIYGIELTDITIQPIEAEPGYITYGYYMDYNKSMCINEDLLADAGNYKQIMDTMAHEMRHGYQHAVVENPDAFQVDPGTVTEWRNNIQNYKRIETDGFKAYRDQPIERDARKFAGWVV